MKWLAAIPVIAQLNANMLGVMRASLRVWGWGSIMTVLLTFSLVRSGEGAPGDLDPTFGEGGTVTTDFGAFEFESALALVLQPDGKLVAVGGASSGQEIRDFALARYRPNGSLDPTFGVGGKVTTDLGGFEGAAAVVLQPDGKLVAAGSSAGGFTLVRYLPNGSLDPTFGIGGKVTTNFADDAEATSLVLQPDGKLVAAGLAFFVENNSILDIDFALARYLPNGSLDPTFGVGGKVTTAVPGIAQGGALVLQPDAKLVVTGGFGDFILVRYLPNGSLDDSFGVGGTVTSDFGGFERAIALVLQPDGKLVVAGGGSGEFILARYLPNGSLDPTFGIGGKVTTDFTGIEGTDDANAAVLQPDGKLVAAGRACANFACDFALARYLPDGSLDPTFGVGGKVITDLGGNNQAGALVLQPDGKLVAAGSAGGDFALARYGTPGIVVNDLVTFDPTASTFTFTPNSTGCPKGFVGTFSFEARLINTSDSSLTGLVVVVTTLTNGNLLQNADGGLGGVGAGLTVPRQDDFTDGVLSPEELVDVLFRICLRQRRPFQFMVDVAGEVE